MYIYTCVCVCVCVCVFESVCYIAEINTVVNQLHLKRKKKTASLNNRRND